MASFSSRHASKVIVATCNLNQWALDFDGNLARTCASISEAKRQGAKLRVGPELELSGYSCEDHFLEMDTFLHCDQSLAAILQSDLTDDILCDIGMPVLHNNVRYNCKVLCHNRRIILIRPKACLANDGNYHEPRFFTSWKHPEALEQHILSPTLAATQDGVKSVPIGMAILQTLETKVGLEICEELWAPQSPHIAMSLQGVEIFCNGSGSHHQLRKLDSRLSLVRNATSKCGGAYLYSNHRGCDGTRLYFDGSSLIALNGQVLAQASQFSLQEVEVVSCVIDLDEIRSFRNAGGSMQEQASYSGNSNFSAQGASSFADSAGAYAAAALMGSSTGGSWTHSHTTYPVLQVPFSLALDPRNPFHHPFYPKAPQPARLWAPEEECLQGPACWLWDFLRRSGASGFLLPLSGGADSSSVCAIVYTMCLLVAGELLRGNAAVRAEAERVWAGVDLSDVPADAAAPVSAAAAAAKALVSAESAGSDADRERERRLAARLCNLALSTVYLGTTNSSSATRNRSSNLAAGVGAYHSTLYIDVIVSAVLTVFQTLSPSQPLPRYELHGGSRTEDIALQNIQARLRMVMSYFMAQLLPWVRGRRGFLLVLASANVDESLRGYMTKYDCSSADVNPIGGICKADLKKMMLFAARKYDLPALEDIANAPPTAELQPIPEDASGADSSSTAAGSSSSSAAGRREAAMYTQSDEEDMGMTYAELTVYGTLRKIHRCGPVSMFRSLLSSGLLNTPSGNGTIAAGAILTARQIADKVKRFFYFYAVNRHKMTTLTPSYHAESYSPDDNRFDFRPFLYSLGWTRQNADIDRIVAEVEAEEGAK